MAGLTTRSGLMTGLAEPPWRAQGQSFGFEAQAYSSSRKPTGQYKMIGRPFKSHRPRIRNRYKAATTNIRAASVQLYSRGTHRLSSQAQETERSRSTSGPTCVSRLQRIRTQRLITGFSQIGRLSIQEFVGLDVCLFQDCSKCAFGHVAGMVRHRRVSIRCPVK